MDIISTMKLTDWSGTISAFSSFYNTRPVQECVGKKWPTICNVYAPYNQPNIIKVKEKGKYLVPCLLNTEKLIGKTLLKAVEQGTKTIGKMRSKDHVTNTTMLVVDLDGLPKKKFKQVLKKLKDLGITFLAYSTHSFGRFDKPGIRCRLVMPVDRILDSTGYVQALKGAQKILFGGLADENAFSLAQAQGVWMAHPDRARLIFRFRHDAGILNAEALLAAAPRPTVRDSNSNSQNVINQQLFVQSRVEAALEWIDFNDYKNWFDTALYLKAAYGDQARGIWLSYSVNGKYNPEEFWDGIEPRLSPSAGAGMLFAMARDRVLDVISDCSRTGNWSGDGKAALTYLNRFHARQYSEIFTEVA